MSQILGVVDVALFRGGHPLCHGRVVVRPPACSRAGRGLLWLGLALQTGALIGRWVSSYQLAAGHTPPAVFLDRLS